MYILVINTCILLYYHMPIGDFNIYIDIDNQARLTIYQADSTDCRGFPPPVSRNLL